MSVIPIETATVDSRSHFALMPFEMKLPATFKHWRSLRKELGVLLLSILILAWTLARLLIS
jgi:hypothetical protein